MINLEQIRQYFVDTIIDSEIFSADSIGWENVVFDPVEKSLWMKESYLNIDEGFSDSTNGDQLQGILSYSINAPMGSYAQAATSAGVALGNLFPTTTVIQTDDYKISIDSTQRSHQGKLSNNSKWYTVVIDVQFTGYEVSDLLPAPDYSWDMSNTIEGETPTDVYKVIPTTGGFYLAQPDAINQPSTDGTNLILDGVSENMKDLPVIDGDFTYAIRLQNRKDTSQPSIVFGRLDSNNEVFYIRYRRSLFFRTSNGSTIEIEGFDITPGVFTVIHITREGDNYSFYQNYLPVESVVQTGQMKPNTLGIGNLGTPSQFFEGSITWLDIYKKALTAEEITGSAP